MGGWREWPYGPFSTTQKQRLTLNDSIHLLRIALLQPTEAMHMISNDRSFIGVNTGLYALQIGQNADFNTFLHYKKIPSKSCQLCSQIHTEHSYFWFTWIHSDFFEKIIPKLDKITSLTNADMPYVVFNKKNSQLLKYWMDLF